MAHIFIATPMYGGMCSGIYVQSLLSLITYLSGAGHTTQCSFMFNESLIPRGRNNLSHQFLKSDADFLFWIDADIKFRAQDVLRMIHADKEIIGGIYPKKEINWEMVKKAVNEGQQNLSNHTGSFVVNLINELGNVVVKRDEPCQVAALGTGFMLVKRSVFDEMKKWTPIFKNDMSSLRHGEEIYAFFETPIEPESGRLLSEDYHFCHQWRKHGGKVYAAPWCELGHMGSYIFEGTLTPTPEPTTMESENGSRVVRNSRKAKPVDSGSTRNAVGNGDTARKSTDSKRAPRASSKARTAK